MPVITMTQMLEILLAVSVGWGAVTIFILVQNNTLHKEVDALRGEVKVLRDIVYKREGIPPGPN